jgi:hypothetical protein
VSRKRLVFYPVFPRFVYFIINFSGPLQRFFAQSFRVKHKEADELAVAAKSALTHESQTPINDENLAKAPKAPTEIRDFDIESTETGAPSARPTQSDSEKRAFKAPPSESPTIRGIKLPSTLRPATGKLNQV